MSTFAVTVERIGRVWKHENADLLEMASLEGKEYDFVVGKGQFIPGDMVVYFPIDSILPTWISDSLNLTGKLAGREQNRVKTVRLRGNISQGVVCSPSQLVPALSSEASLRVGEDITGQLGVTKYELPVIPSQFGDLKPLPRFVNSYDIESAQNFTSIVEMLMDVPCYITEKLEGSHWSATLYSDGEIAVCQRNFRIIPVEGGEHDWHKVLRTQKLDEALQRMFSDLSGHEAVHALTLRGEVLGPGVQNNIYDLKDHEVRIFDVEINQQPVAAARFLDLAAKYGLNAVPVLALDMTLRDWLGGKTLKAASNGKSSLADRLREGVVIKPMTERYEEEIGRVFIKQRSPEYLAKSDL
jgi:RNA ligase (TIGR02306 family)